MRALALPLLLLCARPAGAAFDDAFFGARDHAMAGAFTAVHDEFAAMAYNPAALGQAPALEAGASYQLTLHSPAGRIDRDVTRAAAAIPVRQEIFNGAFGVGVRYDRRDTVAKDREIGLYYGTRGLRETERGGLDFGVGLKTLQTSIDAGGDAGPKPALDFGALWRSGPKRAVGASLLNFGGAKFKSGEFGDRAPLILKLGAAESVRGSLLSIDATVREPSGGAGRSVSLGAGFERWWATARAGSWAIRSGMSLGDRARLWAAGFGWRMGGARLDYAFSVPMTGTARFGHGLTLALRFGRADPEAEYERLLSGEIRARRELRQNLEASALRQRSLSEEIGRLRDEIGMLRESLANKRASEEEARRRLAEAEGRHRKAVETHRALQAEHERNAAKTRAELFREEWAAYQRAKLEGAPDSSLVERVQRLLIDYKESGVDLGEANQELRRLQAR